MLQLTPHAQITNVYEVPYTTLTVFADAAHGTGNDGLDRIAREETNGVASARFSNAAG